MIVVNSFIEIARGSSFFGQRSITQKGQDMSYIEIPVIQRAEEESRYLWVRNVGTVVTCDDDDRILHGVDLYAENGVIKYIGPRAGEIIDRKRNEASERGERFGPTDIIDGRGMILYPGLINTHHHLYQIFSRNLPQVQRMELFPWLKTLYEIWKNLDGNVVYYSTLAGAGELLKTGCTTCLDHHYVFPEGHHNDLLDAQFAAADDLGIRFYATRGSMDLSVKDGGLPPDSVVQKVEEILADSEEAILKYHDPARFSMHRVALAPCSPFSVSRRLLAESAELARKHGVRLHTHLCETKDEEKYMLEKEGIRPLEYMKQVGWVGEDVWFAHGIWFNDEELDFLAQTGTGIAHCPVSNMKLSSGVARVPEMLRRGVPVGLAVDGSASNDGSNLLEEMRAAYLLHRLHTGYDAPSGYEILKMATRQSARLLGRDDIGAIAEEMAADFFMIDAGKLSLVGAQSDPAALLATVGYKGDVEYTVVNGRIVVEHGKLRNIDEEAAARRAGEIVRDYLSRE